MRHPSSVAKNIRGRAMIRIIKWLSLFFIFVSIGLILLNLYSFLIGFKAAVKYDSPREVVQSKASFSKPLSLGEKIGDLYIPKLKESLPILEGVTDEVLMKGVGHFPRSSQPGENNHSVLSGHRDTVFKNLKHLKPSDKLVVFTPTGEFHYLIKKIKIVDANDRTIMTPKPKSTLTLTTCFPFHYIGPAPKRYVITSELLYSKRK